MWVLKNAKDVKGECEDVKKEERGICRRRYHRQFDAKDPSRIYAKPLALPSGCGD
jgi:hypothetical protein